MEFSEYFCLRLREERKRLGFSQQELADHMGVRSDMLGRYERGQAVPGGEALAAFLTAGGDLHYILTGQRSSSAITGDEIKLLSGYRQLDTEGKENILGILDVVGATLKNRRLKK